MPSLQFYPVDISYQVKENRLQTLLFGRMTDGRTVTVIDPSYTPHFYVIPKPNANHEQLRRMAVGLMVKDKNQIFHVTQAVYETVTHNDEKIAALRVYVNTPFAVVVIAKEFSTIPEVDCVLEADLRFRPQYLLHNGIAPMYQIDVEGEFVHGKFRSDYVLKATSIRPVVGAPHVIPRTLAMRVETYQPQKNELADEYPILFLSLYGDDFKRIVTYKPHQTDLEYVEIVKDEAELLLRFKELLFEYKPDVLVGYFSDSFDLPYLKTRAEKHGISFDIGVDYSAPKFTRTTAAKRIPGIVHVDMFKTVKNVLFDDVASDSFALEDVAQKMLGEQKVKLDAQALSHAWDHTPDELEQYEQTSLFLCTRIKRIFERAMPRLAALAKETSAPFFDVCRANASQLIEWYAKKMSVQKGVLIPTRPSASVMKERATPAQGFASDAMPGLYKDVMLLDFRHLYPALAAHHNIAKKSFNADCSHDVRDYVPGEVPQWFCKSPPAFLPMIAGELIRRKHDALERFQTEKNPLTKASLWALKTIANRFALLFSDPNSRWFDAQCHGAAIALCRRSLHLVQEKAAELGLIILVSDQESMLISMGKKDMMDAMGLIDKINFLLPSRMDIDIAAFYSKALVLPTRMGQRRMALLRLNGTCELIGIHAPRRNWSPITKTTKDDIIKLILREDDLSIPINYIRQIVHDLNNQEIPREELIMYSHLQKDISEYDAQLPYVSVARRMEELGIPVGPGSIIKYIITKGDGCIFERARLPEEAGTYDPEYYIRNQLLPAIANIFEAINVPIDEVIVPQDQQTLTHFFG